MSSPVLGQNLEVGDIRLRPLMLGAEYQMPRSKWTWSVGATAGWSVGATAGWSLNQLETANTLRDRVIASTGTDVVTDVHNSFAGVRG